VKYISTFSISGCQSPSQDLWPTTSEHFESGYESSRCRQSSQYSTGEVPYRGLTTPVIKRGDY